MSYDCRLIDHVSGETLLLDAPHMMQGGTYAIGGTREAWLTITFNYSNFYYECHPEGIKFLNGKSGAESIPFLQSMIETIKKNHPALETNPDYWKSCAGNAVIPLYQLRALAQLRPDGVWEIQA